jgi:hypothetical protein
LQYPSAPQVLGLYDEPFQHWVLQYQLLPLHTVLQFASG